MQNFEESNGNHKREANMKNANEFVNIMDNNNLIEKKSDSDQVSETLEQAFQTILNVFLLIS